MTNHHPKMTSGHAVSVPADHAKPLKFYSFQVDIIKTIAIIFVAAFHYFPGQLDWHLQVLAPGWFENYWQQAFANGGANIFPYFGRFLFSYLYVGVNFFVIASGFGLYLSHLKSAKPLNLKQFFAKRIWRLMPPAIFAIVFLFLIQGIFLNHWIINDLSVNFFPFLAGLNLFSNQWFFPPIDGAAWFLGLIIQLYLFFPLLVWLYEKIGEKKFLILLLAVSILFRALYYIFWKDAVSSLGYGLSIGRLFEFGFGMMLAKRFIEGKKLSSWWIPAIFFGLGYFWPWTFPFADGLFGVGAFVLFWQIAKKIPDWKIWNKIATQSYLIFLLHQPFIWTLQGWGFKTDWSLTGVAAFVLLFIFSYYLAMASQWFLDGISRLCSGFLLSVHRKN